MIESSDLRRATIRALIAGSGRRQGDVARSAGLTATYVSDVLAGRDPLSPALAARLAAAVFATPETATGRLRQSTRRDEEGSQRAQTSPPTA